MSGWASILVLSNSTAILSWGEKGSLRNAGPTLFKALVTKHKTLECVDEDLDEYIMHKIGRACRENPEFWVLILADKLNGMYGMADIFLYYTSVNSIFRWVLVVEPRAFRKQKLNCSKVSPHASEICCQSLQDSAIKKSNGQLNAASQTADTP